MKKVKTPLIVAAENIRSYIMTDLIRAGANVNSRDRLGRTALMIACENNDEQSIGRIFKSGKVIDLNTIDKYGRDYKDSLNNATRSRFNYYEQEYKEIQEIPERILHSYQESPKESNDTFMGEFAKNVDDSKYMMEMIMKYNLKEPDGKLKKKRSSKKKSIKKQRTSIRRSKKSRQKSRRKLT
jgi:hypothetical protein